MHRVEGETLLAEANQELSEPDNSKGNGGNSPSEGTIHHQRGKSPPTEAVDQGEGAGEAASENGKKK